MASSEEEGEIGPECVTNYHFVNNRGEPVSFTILPLQGSACGIPDGLKEQIFLRGTVDYGLHQIYKQVLAWKFDLSYVQPEILVLSKNKNWITLQSPRKSFESTIRTILITVCCLHFAKRNLEASEEAIWNHVVKSFSSYEIKPSENDLVDHIPLIREATKSDRDLKKSEYLRNILLDKPWKNKTLHEDVQTTKKPNFIVDGDGAEDDGDEEGDEEEDDQFDHVCALCDNGGELLSCEGTCMRSFHATIEAGAESFCESLGFSNAQVHALPNFLCKNCQYKRHQCHLCGNLGSSGVEVFSCVSATCGHFYHPKCVAKRLHPDDEAQAKELQIEIAAGESFTCPAHKCFLCKQGENKTVHELQFAICRRCPKAYHRKCLPKSISFDSGSSTRAWEGLLPNRILMYCMNHKIIEELGTPLRNHVAFTDTELKMKKSTSLLLSSKERIVENKRSIERKFCRQGFALPKKPIFTSLTSKSLIEKRSGLVKPYKSSTGEAASRRVELSSLLDMRSYPVKPKQQYTPSSSIESAKPAMRTWVGSPPLVDTNLEKRMNALIEKTNASFDEEKFKSKFKVTSTHAYNPKNVLDKITQGKVDASVKAIRTALKKLENGGRVEDAKAVCEPQILEQIMVWKRKLEVYLGPVLHGPRYTSFGRHFTKVDKLEEIVERLHWYVQSGDMVVDFCCGSNDFSCLMKKKLDKMGKKCSFKNYDIIQPKNDFCFEKRDWMTTHSEELPAGSQLIMGLNPPFGFRASLANKFIDQALKFRPKLLILIVPEETKPLLEKKVAYNLIWKDERLLSGKSFYLPGSVDVHDKQLDQWNVNSPPLYLWSRSDWTARHRRIAEDHDHFFNEQKKLCVGGNGAETIISNYLMEENQDCYGDFSNLVHGVGDISHILDGVPEDNDESGLIGTINSPDKKGKGPSTSDDSTENMIKMQCNEKQHKAQSLQGGLDEEKHPKSNETDTELTSSSNSLSSCNNLHGIAHNYVEMETGGRGFGNLQPSSLVHNSRFGTVDEGGTSYISHRGNMHNLMNEYSSSTETVHESSSRGGGTLPDQNPFFLRYGSLPHEPYDNPGFTIYNSSRGYPNSTVYNAAYGYPNSGVYNGPYGNWGSTVYHPTMSTPIGHIKSGMSDLRPPGVSTSSNYTAPAIVYNAAARGPTNYIDPSNELSQATRGEYK